MYVFAVVTSVSSFRWKCVSTCNNEVKFCDVNVIVVFAVTVVDIQADAM